MMNTKMVEKDNLVIITYFPSLQDNLTGGEEVKKKKIFDIKSLYAFDLFCRKKFEDSLDMFKELDTGIRAYFLWDKSICLFNFVFISQ